MKKAGKIAVVGASGFIGQPLYSSLKKKFDVTGTYSNSPKDGMARLDIAGKKAVDRFISGGGYDAVILLAAVTDVDLCERDRELARKINFRGARNVADACMKTGARLVFFSTDFVFDGEKGDYSETDRANPVNFYGKTKRSGEITVSRVDEHVIARISAPYSFARESGKFINMAYRNLKRGEKVRAFADLVRNPTLIEDLAWNVEMLLGKRHSGILNLSGGSGISMYDAALEIADVFGFDASLAEKSYSKDVKFDAKRPTDTSLDVSLAKKLGFRAEPFRQGLLRSKKTLEGLP